MGRGGERRWMKIPTWLMMRKRTCRRLVATRETLRLIHATPRQQRVKMQTIDHQNDWTRKTPMYTGAAFAVWRVSSYYIHWQSGISCTAMALYHPSSSLPCHHLPCHRRHRHGFHRRRHKDHNRPCSHPCSLLCSRHHHPFDPRPQIHRRPHSRPPLLRFRPYIR